MAAKVQRRQETVLKGSEATRQNGRRWMCSAAVCVVREVLREGRGVVKLAHGKKERRGFCHRAGAGGAVLADSEHAEARRPICRRCELNN